MDDEFNRVVFEEMLRQSYRSRDGKKTSQRKIADMRMHSPRDGYSDPSMHFLWLGWCAAHTLLRSAPRLLLEEISPQNKPPVGEDFLAYYDTPGKFYMLRMSTEYEFYLAATPDSVGPVPMPDPSHWIALSQELTPFNFELLH